jgi:4-hydroxyphenylacetate 3-monooxygenase
VFVHNDVQMARAQWFDIPTLAYHSYPAQVRLSVKLRFLLGLSHKMARENGVLNLPPVQETLGQMAAEVNIIQGMVSAVETTGTQYGKYYLPNQSMLYSAMVYAQALYPAFLARMRELAGGSIIGLPSSALDLISPHTAQHIERAHGTAQRTAADRSKLFNLAWDAIGSEFASRHAQYEMFYSGPAFGNRMRNFNTYDWERATSFVDDFMSTYSLPPLG